MNAVRRAFRQDRTVDHRYVPNRFSRLCFSVLVLGIGGAGGNIIREIRSIGALDGLAFDLHWIHIDTGLSHRPCGPIQDREPIVLLSLAQKGTGGHTDLGRTLARKHRYLLMPLLAHADIVIIVAGMGGGTGTGMSPVVARLASAMGALTIAAVTTPFSFEGDRLHRAAYAIQRLRLNVDFLRTFSNRDIESELGDDALMTVIFEAQSQRIANFLRRLLRHRQISQLQYLTKPLKPAWLRYSLLGHAGVATTISLRHKHAAVQLARHTSLEQS